MIKVLFCGLKYEYGKPSAGLSFEYQNFYDVLSRMPEVHLQAFFFDEKIAEFGRDAANELLIKTVEQTKPDLLFCFLFTEEIKKETINYITRKTSTKTFNWFADDHWRFPVYSRYWAPLFTKVSTTDSLAVEKYRSIGIDVIKTQWAANTWLYKPASQVASISANQLPDVAFIGKNYGNRGNYINRLNQEGINAEGFGSGWKNGRVVHEKMLEIFSNSKINLNFTESFFSWPKQLAKLFVKKELGKYSLNLNPHNFQSLLGARRRQVKGRTFEVPACGGFLLTGEADNLGDYYEDGKEIVIFKDKNNLVEKCKYYLAHEKERKEIAEAGYQRTVKDHTYEQRFREIFKAMELKN